MTIQPVLIPIRPVAPVRSVRHVQEQRRAARSALAYCARRCGAPPGGWRKSADEVPLRNDGYYWSVSHKRLWAAGVIADGPVGIDIEHIAPRRRKLHDALAAPDEWVLMGDRSWHAFFRLWTAKEATLKANGMGIAELSACRLIEVPDDHHMTLEYNGQTWRIEHLYHADHATAVTCGSNPVRWRVVPTTANGP